MDSYFDSMLDDYANHMRDYGRMVERHRELIAEARLVRAFPLAHQSPREKSAFNLRLAADSRTIAKMYLSLARGQKKALIQHATTRLDDAHEYHSNLYGRLHAVS